MRPFSKITIALGAYIIISASFMAQVCNFFIKTLGEKTVNLAFLYSLFLIIALYIVYISFKRLSIYRIALSLLVFALAYLVILWQPFFAEKLHVLEYGVLGYLALKDLSRTKRAFSNKNIIYALCFVTLVGSLDEAFQRILPYRVFEVRDIATNAVSGFLGIVQYLIYRSSHLIS